MVARAVGCVGLAAACTVPIDDTRNDKRLFAAQGVIRGTVTYVGPRPCTRDRHVVGDVIILAFDRRNPPPPLGIAASAVNFAVVPGDTLFANEPRTRGAELSCPSVNELVSVSAPFTMSPLAGASYMLVAFYHRSGRFQPQFRYRNQPEAGDLAGGYIDQRDADLNRANPSYIPKYLPVDVGVSGPDDTFSIPPEGALTDNVPITIAQVVPTNRPYFFPDGAQLPATTRPTAANPSGDPRYVPVVTMTQDHRVLAPPTTVNVETLTRYEGSFPAVTLAYGVAGAEVDVATSPSAPFGLPLEPLPPSAHGGLLVFGRGGPLPESPRIPALWPQVTFRKLVDDPDHKADPQSLAFQGSAKAPAVLLQGLTLLDESLVKTVAGPIGAAPSVAALRGKVKVLVRPAALCVDALRPDRGGLLVTPSLTGVSADPTETAPKPVFDEVALRRGLGSLVADVRAGCLPLGRYAMVAAYPSGQVWTTPNEAGACAALEGALVEREQIGSCNRKPRPVLYSQGPRAILEIVPPTTAEGQAACANGVPIECVPR